MSRPLLDVEIRHAVLVRAPRERVYDALATPEGLDGWFTRGSEVDARPGGRIRFRWKDWGPDRISAEDGGPVIEARRPERLVFRWHTDQPPLTTVAIDFEAIPEGTIIRLREHGYPDTPEGRRMLSECAAGWGEALTLAKFYLEHSLRY